MSEAAESMQPAGSLGVPSPQAEMDRAAAGPLSGALAAPKLQDASGKIDPVTGKISLQIGTGDHAQRAIVYQTIQWSFIAGGLITGCVFLFLAFKGDQASVPISVKDAWSLFTPIITLALGYLFGKES